LLSSLSTPTEPGIFIFDIGTITPDGKSGKATTKVDPVFSPDMTCSCLRNERKTAASYLMWLDCCTAMQRELVGFVKVFIRAKEER
jgi:hypothetical protein